MSFDFGVAETMARQIWNHRIPQVVLSFGATDSSSFAQWLQINISEKKCWDQESVRCYIDTFAGARHPGTTLTLIPLQMGANGSPQPGTWIKGWNQGGNQLPPQQVPLDSIGGAVASCNPMWDEYYWLAVLVTRVMIFVVTPAWMNPKKKNCIGEMRQFLNAAELRQQGGGRDLRGIAITFPDEYPGLYDHFLEKVAKQEHGHGVAAITQFPAKKVMSLPTLSPKVKHLFPEVETNPGQTSMQYQLSEDHLNDLVTMIG
jgi:hypothetical protein